MDRTSVVLKINGQRVTPQITGTLKDYNVTYDPPTDFRYNQEVTVSVDAKDMAWVPNAMATETYTLKMVTDTIPPYTTSHSPVAEAVNVPLNTDIALHVRDDLAGVDRSSIAMEVDGQRVAPVITGTEADYTLRYNPQQDFGYNDTVHVVVRAKDLALPPNEMSPDSYWFAVARDESPPYATDHNPRPGEKNVSLSSDISLRLRDVLAGVDLASIKLTVDGEQVAPAVSGTPLNYLASYDPPKDFNDNQTVNVVVQAADRAKPANVMPVEEYTFTTIRDTIPPFTLDHFPARSASNVPLDTEIRVRVRDDLMGVQRLSLVLRINGQVVTPTITGDSKNYLLSHQPPRLSYNDTVRVIVHARDLARPANAMTDRYFFTTVKDLSPPFTTDHHPAKGASFVSPEVDIALHLRDNLAGVDASSIVMKVNGSVVTPRITGSPLDCEVRYDPPRSFGNNEVVTVSVESQDLSTPPNVMAPDSYSFSTLHDTLAPFVTGHNPAKGATNVPRDADIVFHLKDDLAGVNTSSLTMTVEGETVTPSVNGDKLDYEVRYHSPQAWNYNAVIHVAISAQDLATPPNLMPTETYTFALVQDTLPPFVTDFNPVREATQVPVNTAVQFHIRDDLAGVDENSINMTVNGHIVIPARSGQPSDFLLIYQPPEPFSFDQEVVITIDAKDRSSPPNVMPTMHYRLHTGHTLPDLGVANLRVAETDIFAGQPIHCSVEVTNHHAPIVEPFHISFSLDGVTVKDSLVTGVGMEQTMVSTAELRLAATGFHVIEAIADDGDAVSELSETNNSMRLGVQVKPARVTVQPNPFTPNQDGYNDNVHFRFAGLELLSPEVKIFATSGELLLTLRQPNGFELNWDGKDSGGREQMPGVYLYLMQDGEKKIASGTVVLAR